MATAKEYIWATGRRKSAVARVRIKFGTGQIIVNKKPIATYFPTEQDKNSATAPLTSTKTLGKYDVFVNCHGGGPSGQAGAVKLGVARALKIVDPSLEPLLREEGLLTRDPRMKERKKPGLRGARRGTQFSKR
ncbi:MAG: 30S ribosomal protein S9 [Planctomycetota bacterium]|nr:30S ribosomal protein S9 [Planctomycetota bacterium]